LYSGGRDLEDNVVGRVRSKQITFAVKSEPVSVSAGFKDRAVAGRIEFVDSDGIQTAII
jgi:hypothetical protein